MANSDSEQCSFVAKIVGDDDDDLRSDEVRILPVHPAKYLRVIPVSDKGRHECHGNPAMDTSTNIRSVLDCLRRPTQTSSYRTWRNIGGVKYWRIWRIAVDSPKINPPKFCLRNTRLCYNKSVVSTARLHDMVDYLLLTDEHI